MAISPQDKQKLQDYLDSKNITLKTDSKGTSLNDDLPNILGLIVESLYTQTLQNSKEIAAKSADELEVFKAKIALQIFSQALVLASQDQSNFDNRLIADLSESESVEEIYLKVGIYIQEFPEFAYKLMVYAIATYVQECFEFGFKPTPQLVEIYNTFLNN